MKPGADNLRRLSFPLLAFTTPLAVRLIPEAIAWPYPTGFDSLMYVNAMLGGYPFKSPLTLAKSACLFYLLAWAASFLAGDMLVAMKVLGAAIFSAFCGSLYVYARAALNWSRLKSLVASVLAGSYFVSLAMSWQMYRMTLGFAFLTASLAATRIKRFKVRAAALTALSLLTVWSHEIAAVTLFLLMAVLFASGRVERKSLMLAAAPSILLFTCQLYNPAAGGFTIPVCGFQSNSPLQSALYVSGYLPYAFLPIAPLTLLGLGRVKSLEMLSLAIICLAFIFMPVYTPQYSGLWYRWALIIAIPAFFHAVEGLERLWNSGKSLNRRLRVGGAFAIAVLAVNFAMTACYVSKPPESQIKYFGEWNSYKQFIPTSMLQNSVSVRDTGYVVEALKWIKSNLNNNETALVLHEAVDNWAGIVLGESIKHVRVNEADISSPVRENTSKRLVEAAEIEHAMGKNVYTVWWADGKGWYNMPTLPECFVEIIRFGDIAVYRYAPQT
jgi:hypothetical protein